MAGGQAVSRTPGPATCTRCHEDVPNVRLRHPDEGGVRGSDTMVVLSGARTRSPRTCGSTSTLDAEVSAANTNYIGYMGPNAAAREFIGPDILEDPTVNPDQALLDKLDRAARPRRRHGQVPERWNALKA